MFNKYKKKLPIYRDGDITRPEAAEGTTANYFNQQRSSKINTGQALGYGQAALGLASNIATNQNLQGDEKNAANAGAINSTVDSVLGSTTPWYGLANTASGLVDSMVKRDAEGRPVDSANQFIATTAKPMHKSLIEDISKGDYGSAVGDLFGARNIASIAGLFAPKNERIQGMASGEESLFTNGGIQYAQGGINAEVEKQENTLNPDGSTNQYNGPSHEQGGIKTHLDPNTLIFSDKLKHQGKTFASLNKPNNTSKEDKILNDPEASNTLKQTAQLMKDTKIKNSLSLFQIQEELKANKQQSQVEKDFFECGGMVKHRDGGIHIKPENRGKFTAAAKRAGMGVQEYASHILANKENFSSTLIKRANFAHNAAGWNHSSGGVQKYPWGGATDDKGFPIDATGRRLTTEEQMGFNRPSYSYGQNNTNRLSTTNYGATKQFGLTDPNYNQIPIQTTLPKFVYNVGAGTSYEQQQQDYLNKNKLNLGSFAMGGKFPKYENGDKTPEQMIPINIPNPYQAEPSFPNFNPSLYGTGQYDPSNMELRGNPQIQDNTSLNQTNEMSPNWFNRNKDMLYQTGFGLAQNAGQLAYLADQGKKYDTQQFYEYSPSLLDPSAALTDAEKQSRLTALNIRDASGGNAGTYLSNRTALNAQNVINKDRIRQQYANTNAQITNQGKQYNIANKMSVDDINARNKGQALINYYSTLGSVGTNVAQGMKDNRAYNMDKEAIGMLPAMFDNPAYKKYIDEYLSSKGYKKSK